MGRLDRVTEFEDYLGALRVEYKRKRNFIAETPQWCVDAIGSGDPMGAVSMSASVLAGVDLLIAECVVKIGRLLCSRSVKDSTNSATTRSCGSSCFCR